MGSAGRRHLSLAGLATPSEVQAALREALGPSATVSDVWTLAARTRLECSDLDRGEISCSVPTSSGMSLVAAKWLILFTFDGDRLSAISVTKGFVGP